MDKFWRGIRNKCWQTLHTHPEFSLSHPNLMTAWPERRLGDSCCRENGGVSSRPNSVCPFTLTPDPCSVVESLPGAMPLGTDQRGQISRLPSAVGVVCIKAPMSCGSVFHELLLQS